MYSGLEEVSSILQSTAILADFDLDERVYQGHIHSVLQLCELMISRLRVYMSIRPNLLDVFKLWERGDLSSEMVAHVERSFGMQSTEFKEAKSIYQSIDDIKRDSWNLFRTYQWKYTVILILLEWKRAVP
ncbi:hypothetical protein N7451_008471 [Penicillium sp. IBT 35674x]|nr:hypothetical protein N7451_008471 [Penicillium sp. IBT 35674x]